MAFERKVKTGAEYFAEQFGPRIVALKMGEYTVNADGTVDRVGHASQPYTKIAVNDEKRRMEVFDRHGNVLIREAWDKIEPVLKPLPMVELTGAPLNTQQGDGGQLRSIPHPGGTGEAGDEIDSGDLSSEGLETVEHPAEPGVPQQDAQAQATGAATSGEQPLQGRQGGNEARIDVSKLGQLP